ncbi:hypothetical protein Agub_g2597, partial [Astrephomene gubernaculifera]
ATGTCMRTYTMEGDRQWVNTVAVWRPHHCRLDAVPSQSPYSCNTDSTSASSSSDYSGQNLGANLDRVSHRSSQGFPVASSVNPATTVVCGTSAGELCLYDVRQASRAARLVDEQPPHLGQRQGAVYGTAVYGNALAVASAAGSVCVWDLRAAAVRVRHNTDEEAGGIGLCACTSVAMYGPTLVVGDIEGRVYYWSTEEEIEEQKSSGRCTVLGKGAAKAARSNLSSSSGLAAAASSPGAAVRRPPPLAAATSEFSRFSLRLRGPGSKSTAAATGAGTIEGLLPSSSSACGRVSAARLPWWIRQPPGAHRGSPSSSRRGRCGVQGAFRGCSDGGGDGDSDSDDGGGVAGGSGACRGNASMVGIDGAVTVSTLDALTWSNNRHHNRLDQLLVTNQHSRHESNRYFQDCFPPPSGSPLPQRCAAESPWLSACAETCPEEAAAAAAAAGTVAAGAPSTHAAAVPGRTAAAGGA